jgi:hypothetical protein
MRGPCVPDGYNTHCVSYPELLEDDGVYDGISDDRGNETRRRGTRTPFWSQRFDIDSEVEVAERAVVLGFGVSITLSVMMKRRQPFFLDLFNLDPPYNSGIE